MRSSLIPVVAAGVLLAVPVPAAAGTDVTAQPPGSDSTACAVGPCTITVTGPQTVALDGTAGVRELQVVAVGPRTVTVAVTEGGGRAVTTTGAGGTIVLGGPTGVVVVEVVDVSDEGAVLAVSSQATPAQV